MFHVFTHNRFYISDRYLHLSIQFHSDGVQAVWGNVSWAGLKFSTIQSSDMATPPTKRTGVSETDKINILDRVGSGESASAVGRAFGLGESTNRGIERKEKKMRFETVCRVPIQMLPVKLRTFATLFWKKLTRRKTHTQFFFRFFFTFRFQDIFFSKKNY